MRTIVQGIHRPYRVTIDGERLPGEAFTLICACNGRYYGGGFNPCPDAVPDDGLLDFVVVPAVSRLTILTLIGQGGCRRDSADYPAPRPGDARRL